jgi:hypothetical protein
MFVRRCDALARPVVRALADDRIPMAAVPVLHLSSKILGETASRTYVTR